MSTSSNVSLKAASTATGLYGSFGDGEVSLWDGEDQTGFSAGGLGYEPVEIALSVATVGLHGGIAYDDDVDLVLSASATGLHGGHGVGSVTIELDVVGGGEQGGDVRLAVDADGTGLHGGVGTETIRIIVDAAGTGSSTSEYGVGAVTIRLVSTAAGMLGSLGTGAVTIDVAVEATGVTGGYGTGTISLDVIDATGAGWLNDIGSGVANLYLSTLGGVAGEGAQGYGDARGATGEAMVMNAVTKALTLYQAYAMNSIAMFNGNLIAANATGIVLLTGATDDGDPIEASLLTGALDGGVGGQFRVAGVNVEYESGGPLEVVVKFDDVDEFVYRLDETRSDGLYRNRVKTGKGARGARVQLGLSNVDGADFALEGLDADLAPMSRRIA